MASLNFKEKNAIEELFEMGSGYILDFSNSTFRRFVGNSINIDIYEDEGYTEYCSKANKLRQILDDEPENIVAQLLADLCEYYEDMKQRKDEPLTTYEAKKLTEIKDTITKLKTNAPTITLPKQSEETLQTLLQDINSSLKQQKPELVLDRLHTFSAKYLRNLCHSYGISISNDKGEYYPLHSLVGMLKKHYSDNNIFQSEFTVIAIQSSINVFDKYNAIRNNQSYAHDNKVLNRLESEYAIRTIANTLSFIDCLESYGSKQRKQNESPQDLFDESEENLPF